MHKGKIAILLPNLRFGGGERVSLNLGRALLDMGISVDIVLMQKVGEFLHEAEKDFDVHDLSCNRTYELPFQLRSYLRAQQPNLLISSFWKINLCACLAKLAYPATKLFLWEHSPPSRTPLNPLWLYAPSATLMYRIADRIVAVSDDVRQDVARHTLGLSPKLVTIYNPITPPRAHSVVSLRGVRPQIIFVGRLDPQKNPELLLTAFARSQLDATLLIVGDGPLKGKLTRLSQTLGISDRVTLAGFMEDPYAAMLNSDLLVLSSDFEGFGNVIVEAMFCGLPIVSTDCGPVRELLGDGRHGTIVPVNDPEALARAMRTELGHRRSPLTQIEAAERFLPQVAAQKFMTLLSRSGVPIGMAQ